MSTVGTSSFSSLTVGGRSGVRKVRRRRLEKEGGVWCKPIGSCDGDVLNSLKALKMLVRIRGVDDHQKSRNDPTASDIRHTAPGTERTGKGQKDLPLWAGLRGTASPVTAWSGEGREQVRSKYVVVVGAGVHCILVTWGTVNGFASAIVRFMRTTTEKERHHYERNNIKGKRKEHE